MPFKTQMLFWRTINESLLGNCRYSTLYLLQFSSKTFIQSMLQHKDSFGKSGNLSKIFFTEILVFDHDYEGKSSSSNGLL